jgi:hypothetical protein
MTTYSYNLVLDDGEIIMLKAALKLMVSLCDEQLRVKPEAPFFAWKHSAEKLQTRLCSNVVQQSGNTFFDTDG